MAIPIKRKIFSLLIIWILLYICYLRYKDPGITSMESTLIKDEYITLGQIEKDTIQTRYLFNGQKINSSTAEIDRYHSATPCQSPPFILLVINSHVEHRLRRDGIRKTWGSVVSQKESDALPTILWRTVFIVGVVDDRNMMVHLHEEAKLFNDIIIGNIRESRRHLTDKTVLGMIWAQLFCQPTFFFKGDDDIWVNQFSLYKYIRTVNQSIDVNTFWKGYVAADNRKPIRNKHSKYYLSKQDFSGDQFPPFCSGFGYIMSSYVLQAMIQVIKDVRFLPLVDDVYVGLLGNKSGIQPKLEYRFHLRTLHGDVKKEVQSAFAKHRVMTIGQQIKFRNISFRHYLDKICTGEPRTLNSDFDYLEDFQLFFYYNFKRELNCSDIKSIA